MGRNRTQMSHAEFVMLCWYIYLYMYASDGEYAIFDRVIQVQKDYKEKRVLQVLEVI